MNPSEATREVLWNIGHAWIMYVLLVPTLGIAGFGVYRRWRLWRQGQAVDRWDQPWRRLRHVWEQALLQRRTMRKRYAGIFHALIFWGVLTLVAATTVVMIHHDFGLPIMRGAFYLYFQSLFVDILGMLAVIGVAMAAFRRWVSRPRGLVYTDEASWILGIGFVILVSGFLVEGWRIGVTADPWGIWSPFGYLVARASLAVAPASVWQEWHWWFWWGHLLLAFGFIAWAPYTKMIHPLTSLLNIYTANLEPVGASLKAMDFESEDPFGVNQLKDFTWKDRLDFDACTECGRCTDACPANGVGKLLSPRDLILGLRDQMHAGLKSTADGSCEESSLVEQVEAASNEALWQCTTCAACVEACPVSIEQLPKIVDLRRFQVMEEAAVPDSIQAALTSLETRGHPFTGSRFSRVDWADGMEVPEIQKEQEVDVLLWIGCGGALVERNQRGVRALATVLQRAKVSFAILGRSEKCTGDPARRVGNEFLFEQLAQENIETLSQYRFQRVVTSCPHCFNSFRNEYPRLGFQSEVVHHSEFLGRLVEEGRLRLTPNDRRQISFHDPCYLSRHNGMTQEPRKLLESSSQRALVEPTRHGSNSFCCGGGGGMSFVDEPADQRVNHERSRELLASGADTIAVGCPFCATMLEDGINANKGDRKVEVKELAELVLEASEPSPSSESLS